MEYERYKQITCFSCRLFCWHLKTHFTDLENSTTTWFDAARSKFLSFYKQHVNSSDTSCKSVLLIAFNIVSFIYCFSFRVEQKCYGSFRESQQSLFFKRFLEHIQFLRREKTDKLFDVSKQLFLFDFSGYQTMHCFPLRCIFLDLLMV